MMSLWVYRQNEAILRFPLEKHKINIGRSGECDLSLNDELLSREQLEIFPVENRYFVKNIGQAPLSFQGKAQENFVLKEEEFFEVLQWRFLLKREHPQIEEEVTHAFKPLNHSQTAIYRENSEDDSDYVYQNYELELLSQGASVQKIKIDSPVLTLGKSRRVDVMLEDPYLSDVHCKMVFEPKEILLLDLNSTNGCFVNGVRIKQASLKMGDQIQIGQTKLILKQREQKESKAKKEEQIVPHFGPLVGQSIQMRSVFRLIEQVAQTEAPVMILGETGVGKELVAKAIHEFSSRKSKNFIAINCGALSKELILSELFGHEKGAFTGAVDQRRGAFEMAHGGTLFLDEMGELPSDLQASLLRVLETGKVRRLGAEQEIAVNTRIVCATHRDLNRKVKEGEFREDLFYRLFVFPVWVPPLQERSGDILILANHFLQQMQPLHHSLALSIDAQVELESRDWPGNVRELKNVIQRAVILAGQGGVIEAKHLVSPGLYQTEELEELEEGTLQKQEDEFKQIMPLADMEKKMILRALRTYPDNRQEAAKALGIAKSTLYQKLKEYGIK